MVVPVLATLCGVLLAAHLVTRARRRPGGPGTAAERATFDTLLSAGLAANFAGQNCLARSRARACAWRRPSSASVVARLGRKWMVRMSSTPAQRSQSSR